MVYLSIITSFPHEEISYCVQFGNPPVKSQSDTTYFHWTSCWNPRCRTSPKTYSTTTSCYVTNTLLGEGESPTHFQQYTLLESKQRGRRYSQPIANETKHTAPHSVRPVDLFPDQIQHNSKFPSNSAMEAVFFPRQGWITASLYLPVSDCAGDHWTTLLIFAGRLHSIKRLRFR